MLYMETLIGISFAFILGVFTGRVLLKKQEVIPLSYWKKQSGKNRKLFDIANELLKIKQSGYRLSSWFREKGYADIAIYGMANIGKRLADELYTDMNILYGIDKSEKMESYRGIEIISPDSELKKTDAIVVTVPMDFYEISKALQNKTDCPILSIEEILYEISQEVNQ